MAGKGRVDFSRIRETRLKKQQETQSPPPLPENPADLYEDGFPTDVPVMDAPAEQKSNVPDPTQIGITTRQSQPDEDELSGRVEARVSEAELSVIKQLVRRRKAAFSNEGGEGYNRQDLVREALLLHCRALDPDFDEKVKSMENAFKVLK